MTAPATLFDKLWTAHEIVRRDDGESLLWVDRHYIHEGSCHAFAQVEVQQACVAEPGLTFAVRAAWCPVAITSVRLRRDGINALSSPPGRATSCSAVEKDSVEKRET